MFRPLLSCVLALLPAAAAAQPVPGEANREAMKKLDYLVGKWKGEATVAAGPKDTRKITQTEDVQLKLNGTVIVVEGVGRGKLPGKDQEGVVFNALAVISYDDQAKKYAMKAYRMEGLSVDAHLTPNEKGFVWGFKEPQRGVEVRYVMTLTPKGEWHEVGEYSLDGKAWTKFFEMTLTRVKEKP